MNDSLIADYMKERLGFTTIFKPGGFITYRINGGEAFLAEIFVSKEKRKSGLGREMLIELLNIAKKNKCVYVSANIHLHDKGANNTLRAALSCGFNVSGADQGQLVITKEV